VNPTSPTRSVPDDPVLVLEIRTLASEDVVRESRVTIQPVREVHIVDAAGQLATATFHAEFSVAVAGRALVHPLAHMASDREVGTALISLATGHEPASARRGLTA